MASGWTAVTDTLIAEFSDIPDLAGFTRVVVRLVLAALLGALLGYERGQKGKAAGVRTHMLVAMGSAMFVLVPAQIGVSPADMTRVVQGIVAGIGFLGAGTIWKGDTTSQVKGLTTAAGIWLTAAIGIAAGLGREVTAILATLFALFILFLLPLIAPHLDRPARDEP
ncbi:MgtC/SapB family protein [Rhizobacter sp. Root1221]|uniref:MgtC/SapB family protein n=1 Tax=Rhizobacter sp. Root1221 TaxID=1736433 RepID=UPI0006FDD4C8|nr:MgtC/SapB family protein [Rhizobacter sp. Root1221]KQW02667.1 methyltransferase [Rhizobacter sp. Root1221]